MEITGRVHKLFPTEQISDKFSKRVVVIETKDGEYTQTIPVEFTQKNIDKINNVSEGQEVTVAINLRGNEYKGKFYSSIQGWKIDVHGGSPAQPKATTPQEEAFANDTDDSDLPF